MCAALLGRPTVSLGHSEKNDTLQQLLGLGAYCGHIEQIDPAAVVAQVDELVAQVADDNEASHRMFRGAAFVPVGSPADGVTEYRWKARGA